MVVAVSNCFSDIESLNNASIRRTIVVHSIVSMHAKEIATERISAWRRIEIHVFGPVRGLLYRGPMVYVPCGIGPTNGTSCIAELLNPDPFPE